MRRSAAAACAAFAVLLGGCAAVTPPPSTEPSGDPEGSATPSVHVGSLGQSISVGPLAVTVLAAGEWPAKDQTLGPDLHGVSVRVRLLNRGGALTLADESFQLVDQETGVRYLATSRREAGDLALPLRLASGDSIEGLLSFTPPRKERFSFRLVAEPGTIGEAALGRIGGRLAPTWAPEAPAPTSLPAPVPSVEPAADCLRITGGDWDPAGPDDSPTALAAEYVKVRNVCTRTVALRGWTLYDRWRQNAYAFADRATVAPGKTFRLYSGSGTPTALRLYWERRREVWGNAAPERAYLADPSGTVVSDWSPYP